MIRRLRTHAAIAAASLVVLAAVNLAQADSMLAPGDPFPSWRLKDQTGTERSSVQYAGKRYLLWFFPKAMTPGCTVEGRGLRDSYADFERANVSVLGISADEPAQNAAFVSQERFPFPLLSDPELELAIKVGAATGASDARARRISYLVGPDGKVLRVYDKVDPVSHADLVLRDIEQSGAPRQKHDETRSPN